MGKLVLIKFSLLPLSIYNKKRTRDYESLMDA